MMTALTESIPQVGASSVDMLRKRPINKGHPNKRLYLQRRLQMVLCGANLYPELREINRRLLAQAKRRSAKAPGLGLVFGSMNLPIMRGRGKWR